MTWTRATILLTAALAVTPAAAQPDGPFASPAQPKLPEAPIPYAETVRRQPAGPVFLDERDRTPDAPLGLKDLAYDSRLRAAFASAQAFQGPLDGNWVLTTSAGRASTPSPSPIAGPARPWAPGGIFGGKGRSPARACWARSSATAPGWSCASRRSPGGPAS